jgi:hypothetical protein
MVGEAHDMDVKRTGIVLKPTNSHVVIRQFDGPSEARVASLPKPRLRRGSKS